MLPHMKALAAAVVLLALAILAHAWITRPPRYLPTTAGDVPFAFDTRTGQATIAINTK